MLNVEKMSNWVKKCVKDVCSEEYTLTSLSHIRVNMVLMNTKQVLGVVCANVATNEDIIDDTLAKCNEIIAKIPTGANPNDFAIEIVIGERWDSFRKPISAFVETKSECSTESGDTISNEALTVWLDAVLRAMTFQRNDTANGYIVDVSAICTGDYTRSTGVMYSFGYVSEDGDITDKLKPIVKKIQQYATNTIKGYGTVDDWVLRVSASYAGKDIGFRSIPIKWLIPGAPNITKIITDLSSILQSFYSAAEETGKALCGFVVKWCSHEITDFYSKEGNIGLNTDFSNYAKAIVVDILTVLGSSYSYELLVQPVYISRGKGVAVLF